MKHEQLPVIAYFVLYYPVCAVVKFTGEKKKIITLFPLPGARCASGEVFPVSKNWI